MIRSFKDADSKKLFETRSNRRWRAVETVALRRLDQIEASVNLADLRIPPGNRLEDLKGDRAGQHSICIHDQFRICFLWNEDGAREVEITDCH